MTERTRNGIWKSMDTGRIGENELNRIEEMGTSRAWTAERRAKQVAIINQTRPWEKATGPRTENGKAISSRNATMPEPFRTLRVRLTELREINRVLLGRMPPR